MVAHPTVTRFVRLRRNKDGPRLQTVVLGVKDITGLRTLPRRAENVPEARRRGRKRCLSHGRGPFRGAVYLVFSRFRGKKTVLRRFYRLTRLPCRRAPLSPTEGIERPGHCPGLFYSIAIALMTFAIRSASALLKSNGSPWIRITRFSRI